MDLNKLNKYQTPITDELKKKYHKEIWNELLEYLSTVKFLQNLIAPEEIRGFAKDRPKETKFYDDGRIDVDITKPHILEDLDFFRERAIFFENNGKYTNLIPNSNPKSEYANFWKEELHRWKYGMVRPSDGEWIPGYLYFYWNYSPIWLVVNKKGSKQGDRVRKFPKPWLGDYIFFHYLDQARCHGKHGKNLKARGIGMSFKNAAMSPRNMYVYPGAGNVNFHLANEKSYLQGDKGLYGKVLEVLDHIADTTPLPRMRLIDGKKEMVVQLGYTDEYGGRKGLLSSTHAISLKDNPDKARGARGVFCHYEEDGIFDNLEKAWNVNRPGFEDGGIAVGLMLAAGCLTENNKVWNNKGELVSIKDLNKSEGILGWDKNNQSFSKEDITYWQPPTKKDCVKITTNTGRTIECSYDHPILWSKLGYQYTKELPKYNKKRRRTSFKKVKFKEAQFINIGDQLATINEVPIFSNKVMWEPRVVGWLVGDGSYGINKTPVLSNCDIEINNYVHANLDYVTEKTYTTKDGKLYEENRIRKICGKLRELGIYGQTKGEKTLPKNIHSYSKHSISEFIGGFFDADGYVGKKGDIHLASGHKEILLEMQLLLQKFGIHGVVHFKKPNPKNPLDKEGWYDFEIKDKSSCINFHKHIKFIIKTKQERLDKVPELFKDRSTTHCEHLPGMRFERVVSIEKVGLKEVYNLTAGNTHTYIGNGIITHNTGGVEGASFEGSQKLFYNHDSYNIYGIPNVFDKNTDGSTTCGHFWGAYLNRHECYDLETGEPDIIKSLLEILTERFTVKYGSSDPNAITQKKAELPITPQEAIMRTEGTVFPIADIKSYLETITPKKEAFLAEHLVGDLIVNSDGQVEWKPNSDISPLRSFESSDTNRTGAVEIFEMPKKNAEGVIPRGRYIAGIDPIDSDAGASLFSVIVMDLFTDRIVAEYTGRPKLASDAYETTLRLLKFYNAEGNYESNLKGLFSYFDNKNALYYLADVPQILKDMEMVKATNLFGNKAHPYSEKVYTPNGVKFWGDIQIGDELFSTDGNTTKVIDIPFDNDSDIYEITLKDGRRVKASSNHLWNVVDWSGYEKILSTFEIKENYYRYKGKYKEFKYYIPKNEGVEYENKKVSIDPYTLGLLLGDGSFSLVRGNVITFASNLKDIETYKKESPYEFTKPSDNRHMYIKIPNIGKYSEKLNLKGVKSRTKFIPNIYKYNSKEVRLNILKGLLDTDGCVGYGGNPEYCTTSKLLAYDVIEISRSLGINCNLNITTNTFGKVYKVRFYSEIPLFKLKRKYSKQKITKTRAYKTAIVNIKYLGREKSKCVTVDSKDSCYLIADYITTHNSKGTHANKQINSWGRQLQAEYMLTDAHGHTEEDEDGNIISTKLNLHTIRSIPYLEECIAWNSDGNFDRVSAAGMLFILREDRRKRTETARKNKDGNPSHLSNDPFFKKNFKQKRYGSFL